MTSININLLPPEIFEKRRAEKILLLLVGGVIIFVAALLAISSLISLQVSQREKRVEGLRKESAELNRKIAALKGLEEQKIKLQDQEKMVKKALSGEIPWYEVLYEVGMVIPSDVWLTSLTSGADGANPSIKFKGYTFGHPSVAQWLLRLGEVKNLDNIWLDYSQQSDLQGQSVVEFETTANLSGVSGSAASKTSSGE